MTSEATSEYCDSLRDRNNFWRWLVIFYHYQTRSQPARRDLIQLAFRVGLQDTHGERMWANADAAAEFQAYAVRTSVAYYSSFDEVAQTLASEGYGAAEDPRTERKQQC